MFVVPVARVQRRTEGGAISTPKSGTDGPQGEGSSQHDVTTWYFQRLQTVDMETLVGGQWDTRRHGVLWNWPWRLSDNNLRSQDSRAVQNQGVLVVMVIPGLASSHCPLYHVAQMRMVLLHGSATGREVTNHISHSLES